MRVYTAQMALLAKPTLGMLPGPDQMQKDRPQFTQVRPRTVIERATSLGSWLPHNHAKPRDLTLRFVAVHGMCPLSRLQDVRSWTRTRSHRYGGAHCRSVAARQHRARAAAYDGGHASVLRGGRR